MKRLLFASILSAICLSCMAQEKQLLKEALERGINSRGIYRIENSKNKSTDLNKMSDFLRREGYIPLGGDEKKVRRFGDVSYILDYYNFTDHAHYQDYVFSALSGKDASTFREMRNKGSFYTVKEGTTRKGIDGKSIWPTKYDMLTRVDDAVWTGNVRNGMIDGSGSGLVMSEGSYIWFEGEFANGIPVSSISTRTAQRNGDGTIKSGISRDGIEPLSLLACAYNLANADSQLSSILKSYLSNRYQENGKAVESAYQKVRSITITNCADFKPDEMIPLFVACYEKVGSDPQNYLAKAREVAKVYQVIPALNLKIRDKYYGASLWTLLSSNWDWFDSYENADRKCLSEGLESAKWGKSSSRFGFNNFFSQAYTNIQRKYNQFNSKIDTDRADYRRKYNQQAKENESRSAEYKRQMAQEAHDVDWDKCKDPSGELYWEHFGSSASWIFEHDGYIQLKNGHRYTYNVILDKSKNVDHYVVTGTPSNRYLTKTEFKTTTEMIAAIEKADRR